MVDGIKDCHITKFSRLVQELGELLDDIHEYCPEANIYVSSDDVELWGESSGGSANDYGEYVISEHIPGLDCGADIYEECFDEDAEIRLRYRKKKRVSRRRKSSDDDFIKWLMTHHHT